MLAGRTSCVYSSRGVAALRPASPDLAGLKDIVIMVTGYICLNCSFQHHASWGKMKALVSSQPKMVFVPTRSQRTTSARDCSGNL